MNRDKVVTLIDAVIKWCIWSVVFAAPFSKSLSEVAICVSIAAWIIKKVLRDDIGLRGAPLGVPILIFVMAMMPSFLNAPDVFFTLRAFISKVLKYAAFFFVVVESIDTKSKLRDLLAVGLVSASVIMSDGFLQYWFGVDGLHFPGYPSYKYRLYTADTGFFRGYPTACFPFPNDLAAWILLVLFPIASAAIFDLKGRKARYLVGAVSLGLFSLFTLAKVRGAWVAMAISALYMAVSKKKIWLIIALVLAMAVPYLLRMEMSRYVFDRSSFGDRFAMWGTSWDIFKRHPVIGNGLNTFFRNYREMRNDEWKGKKGSYAHNCYLQMAADTGIVGLAGFGWLMIAYFASVVRALRRIRDPFFAPVLWGMSIGIFAFLIHSAFDTNLYSLNLVTLFWTSIAVSQAIIRVCDGKAART